MKATEKSVVRRRYRVGPGPFISIKVSTLLLVQAYLWFQLAQG